MISKCLNVKISDNSLPDDIFIVKNKGNYRVLRTNIKKAVKVTNNKKMAIKIAKSIQNSIKTTIFEMDDNGKIIELYPYSCSSKSDFIIYSKNDTTKPKSATFSSDAIGLDSLLHGTK